MFKVKTDPVRREAETSAFASLARLRLAANQIGLHPIPFPPPGGYRSPCTAEVAAMSGPPDPPPDPPLAHRAESDSSDDDAYDSGFDSAAAERRVDLEAKRRQRTALVIVLLAVLLPFAGCGFLFAVCSLFRF